MSASDQTEPLVTVSKRSNRTAVFASIIFILLLVASVFLARQRIFKPVSLNPGTTSGYLKTSPLFESQTGIIKGQIIKLDDKSATIKNNAGSETFPLSKYLSVMKQATSSAKATVSTNPKDIEQNKDATILLTVVDGKYQINSISYLPPATPAPTPK